MSGFDPAQYGIFADSALGEMDTLQREQTPEGVQMQRPCDRCLRDRRIEISWGEIACLAYGILPQQLGRPDLFPMPFRFDPNFRVFTPQIACNCDGRHPLIFQVTPQDAQRYLQDAQATNLISPDQKAIIQQFVMPAINQMRQQQVARAGATARPMPPAQGQRR